MSDNSMPSIERWDSVKSVKEAFEDVPEDVVFKIILRQKGRETERFKYLLNRGKSLPATIPLKSCRPGIAWSKILPK